jgi:hypothetical protein
MGKVYHEMGRYGDAEAVCMEVLERLLLRAQQTRAENTEDRERTTRKVKEQAKSGNLVASSLFLEQLLKNVSGGRKRVICEESERAEFGVDQDDAGAERR